MKAITYQSGERKSQLRTVVVEDVRRKTTRGGQELVLATLLHGTACRHKFWEDELGQTGDDFVIEAELVRAIREIAVAVKARSCK